MRKIKSKEEIQRAQKRNAYVVGGILIALLVLSTAGFALMNLQDTQTQGAFTGESITEYGLLFQKNTDYWLSYANGLTLATTYLPSEVAQVTLEGDFTLDQFSAAPLYFTSKIALTEVVGSLYLNLFRYQEACLAGEPCSDDTLPVKDCSENIIVSVPGERDKIYKQEKCIYFVGDELKVADAFVYRMAGII